MTSGNYLYVGKEYDAQDINYILRKYLDHIPEKLISDFYHAILEYVPLDSEESKWTVKNVEINCIIIS